MNLIGSDYNEIDCNQLNNFINTLDKLKHCKDVDMVANWIIGGWKYLTENIDQLDHGESKVLRLASSWARLTREVVAGSERFQVAVLPSVDYIIKFLWNTSAIVRLDHQDFVDLNRFCIQALSNLITLNPETTSYTWKKLTDCEGRESVLVRLLFTKDNRILLTISILILNAAHKNIGVILSLLRSNVGKQIITMLMERLDGLLENESDIIFEILVNLVREICTFDSGSYLVEFYNSQKKESQVISPGQVSTLKVLDSSLVPPPKFLIEVFFKLSNKKLSLIDSNKYNDDMIWSGLYLICEIMVKWVESNVEQHNSINQTPEDLKEIFDEDLCQVCLKSLEILKKLPKVTEGNQNENKESLVLKTKIVLVKLLSSFCNLKGSIIQDLIRENDGIPLILEYTQFDVDQPYLREHALFLIRNLLLNNSKNQELISKIQPIAVFN